MKREVFVRMCEKEEREITQFQMQSGGGGGDKRREPDHSSHFIRP